MPEFETRAKLGPAAGRPALPLPVSDSEKSTEDKDEVRYLGLIPDKEPGIYDDLKPQKMKNEE